MLAIRLQRTGRKGHAQYRMVVQDARRSPLSGNVVAHLGSYNPHTKKANIDTDKAQTYLKNGAQPSDRVVGLLKKEGVKLPKWVSVSAPGKRTTRNPEKLRKNQAEQSSEAQSSTSAEADSAAAASDETKAATPKADGEAEERPTEPAAEEAKAEPANEADTPTEAEKA